ncbi:MAG: hypothetical protein HY831_00680 [Candidatus Aenigmarchaeota archaeon]|nr:hypothetical protein [Candidatus Aenigmarchaeota archaeon]
MTTYFDRDFVRRAYEGVEEMPLVESMLSKNFVVSKKGSVPTDYFDVNRYCVAALDQFGNMSIKYTGFDRDFFLKIGENEDEVKLNGNSSETQWQKCRIVKYRHIFSGQERFSLAVAFYNGHKLGLIYEALNLFRGFPNITTDVNFDYTGVRNGKVQSTIKDPVIGMSSVNNEILVFVGDRDNERFLEEGGVGRVSHGILPTLRNFLMPILTGDFLFYTGEEEFYTTQK